MASFLSYGYQIAKYTLCLHSFTGFMPLKALDLSVCTSSLLSSDSDDVDGTSSPIARGKKRHIEGLSPPPLKVKR